MLQRFLPGIGQLLLRSGAPAVPAFIEGAFEALPRGRRVPKVHQITVVFGHPEPVDVLRVAGTGRTDEERIASALRQRVAALAGTSLTTPGQATAVLAEDETDSIRR